MTLYSAGESPAGFVARMRAEHGLPPKCSDAAVLGRIARELVEASTKEGPGDQPGPSQPADHPDERAINEKTT